MTFGVMNKVMNNFKRLGNSTLNELVNENVIPKSFLKNLETPEKSTSLAFFFIFQFQCFFNVYSMSVASLFLGEFKET